MTTAPRLPFVPPPYPYDRLDDYKAIASKVDGGLVDLSIGTPVDPMPDLIVQAMVSAAQSGVGYPASIGSPAFRQAASDWMGRRLAATVPPDQIIACMGTKELVAMLPHALSLRDPSRDTVLYPATAYPTYEMGATLAGLRAVPIPVDADWHPDLSRIAPEDAERALLLWLNEPGNPTGSVANDVWFGAAVEWARARGIVVASDECYVEFVFDGAPRSTALSAGDQSVLAVHALSKRSNMAGMRVGFMAGDADLIHYVGEIRKHAGYMVPGPVQAAAVAALGDDEHVEAQKLRYAERRRLFLEWLATSPLEHAGGPGTFYLWVRTRDRARPIEAWELARRMAETGMLVAPGDVYGERDPVHVRIALVQPLDRIRLAVERLSAASFG